MIMNELADQSGDPDAPSITVNIDSDYMKDFVKAFEDKVEARKQKRIDKKKGLEVFIDDEEESEDK
jgi:hypothetical protein